jgi:hypothetical protein
MMAWGVLAHLPYNAYKVNELISGSSFTQANYIIHIIVYISILIAGAKVHSQVGKISKNMMYESSQH